MALMFFALQESQLTSCNTLPSSICICHREWHCFVKLGPTETLWTGDRKQRWLLYFILILPLMARSWPVSSSIGRNTSAPATVRRETLMTWERYVWIIPGPGQHSALVACCPGRARRRIDIMRMNRTTVLVLLCL